MTAPVYNWNPFQDDLTCNIKNETLTSQGGDRVILIPRAAPFFTRNLVLRNAVTNTVLTEGQDYTFIYMFEDFVKNKNALVYGGIVLLGNTGVVNYSLDYSTIGGPFVLDDNAFAQAIVNISTTPRVGDWRDVTNLPIDGFPADPHEHPLSQTINYVDMLTAMRALAVSMNNEVNNPTVLTDLVQHEKQSLAQAHGGGTPKDVGLGLVRNFGYATTDDFPGNSNELIMSLGVTKQLFSQLIRKALGDYDTTDTTIDLTSGITQTGLGLLNNIDNPNTFAMVTDPIMINLTDTIVIMIGENRIPLTTLTGAEQKTYEGSITVNFPKPFAKRPAILLQNYDGVNFTREYVNYQSASPTAFIARGGGDTGGVNLGFLWVAIGILAS